MGRVPALATTASLVAGGLMLLAAVFTALAPTARSATFLAVGLVSTPLYAGAGLLVARRQRTNLVGLLLTVVATVVAFTVAKEIGWGVLAEQPDPGRLAWLVAVLNESVSWGFAALALTLLYFPDGALPSRRWRWVPWALVAAAATHQAYGTFEQLPFRAPLESVPRPFGAPPVWFELAGFLAFVTLMALVLAATLSPWIRLRRADEIRRRQLRWLALGAAGLPAYPAFCLLEIALWGRPLWTSVGVGVITVVSIPVAVAIAIIRHDLYDVDTAFAATVTWVLVTVILVSVYAGISFLAGVVLGGESAALAAAATALCALALQPLRGRLQQAVDRRAYPLRRAAIAAVATLHREVNAGRARPEELESVLRTTVRDPALRIGYAVPRSATFVDADGHPVDPAAAVPLVLDGVRIGVLVPGGRGASTELLRQVAERATTLVELARLRLELARALDQVEASRTRLLQAGYDERRRLERDLHDGAQQRLVSLGMSLRVAQRRLRRDAVDVEALLDQSVAELGIAVAELRQIAHGLRPGSLDDGLRAAVTALVRTVPVEVEMEICSDQLPDDVATTAYYILSEALVNAVKHADAGRIRLQVTREDSCLTVRIGDDGRGGARIDAASSIADRVAALGGRLRVVSPPGSGTVVEAALPCGS